MRHKLGVIGYPALLVRWAVSEKPIHNPECWVATGEAYQATAGSLGADGRPLHRGRQGGVVNAPLALLARTPDRLDVGRGCAARPVCRASGELADVTEADSDQAGSW